MIEKYKLIKSLGKGGMGEVFLAFDKDAKRLVALKKIREDLQKNELVKKRFTREAEIASSLCHPSIIPIYEMHLEDPTYYTMPYVEGKTLKEILKTTKVEPTHPIGSSIPTLIRLFLNVCEAISYIHSKNILHRDIKPDNIIIGKHSEVMLLDWGIAKAIDEKEITGIKNLKKEKDITLIGKVAGTITYMAPERALGKEASFLSDIYSLGIILYQILTLDIPFKRKDIKTFKRTYHLEKVIDPIEKAPFRDIPQKLVDITLKCLSIDENLRYQSVDELIEDIKNYIDGKADWSLSKELNIKNQDDWQFNENIFHAKHLAILENFESSKWLNLLVSKESFSSNIKIEADVLLKKESNGICFLLNIFKNKKNFSFSGGYKIWIRQNSKESEIIRSGVPIFKEKLNVKPNNSYHITIEKMDDKFTLFINDKLIFSHINYIPIKGSFFGLAFEDFLFEIKNIKIFNSSYNVMVNCLSIAEAFYAIEDYDNAILEYQKIASSFSHRKEGLEAVFRIGISYIEKAKKIKNKTKKNKSLLLAMNEFEKLHKTLFEPLEYLGKSLVYQEKNDFIEEAKCLELMIRKFLKHFLFPIIKEYLIYRMHQSSSQNRLSAYRIILIALRFIPNIFQNVSAKNLFYSLKSNLENIYFLQESEDIILFLIIKLSFILNNPNALLETLQKKYLDEKNLKNIIFSLIELNHFDLVKIQLEKFKDRLPKKDFEVFDIILNAKINDAFNYFLKKNLKKLTFLEESALIYILDRALNEKKSKIITDNLKKIQKIKIFNHDNKILIDSILIKASLLQNTKEIKQIPKNIFDNYLKQDKIDEKSPLHFPYGIWLYRTKGKDVANKFFTNILETISPVSFNLPTIYMLTKDKSIFKKSFEFEKRRLSKDLLLFKDFIKDF